MKEPIVPGVDLTRPSAICVRDLRPGDGVGQSRTGLEPVATLSVDDLGADRYRIVWEGMAYPVDMTGDVLVWIAYRGYGAPNRSRVGRVVGSAGKPYEPTDRDWWAGMSIRPSGGEAFGTKVTFWDYRDRRHRAVIVDSFPHPESAEIRFNIMIQGRGLTVTDRWNLTFGWREDCVPAED